MDKKMRARRYDAATDTTTFPGSGRERVGSLRRLARSSPEEGAPKLRRRSPVPEVNT
jgi:hypothetical protein